MRFWSYVKNTCYQFISVCTVRTQFTTGTAEQFQHGGGADIECHQKSSPFKYIPSEQWGSQGGILEGKIGLHQGGRKR